MRRLRLFLVLVVFASSLVALNASPASASVHAKACRTHSHLNGAETHRICAFVNQHDFWQWRQGVVCFWGNCVSGITDGGQVYIDYVLLRRDGVVVERVDPDRWINPTGPQQIVTDWDEFCNGQSHSWQGGGRYKIQWPNGDRTSFWAINSGQHTTSSC